jgi:aminoglycoside 3-N-acetyltransferase
MSDYISYQHLPSLMDIKKGDIVLLSSDITDLYIQCKKHGERFDINLLINRFQEAVGKAGTLLIPTYNWGFCQGKTFDYRHTPSKTGVIGDTALKRADFIRTKHPIYSFAVWGKDADYLFSLDDIESFGSRSPFAYLEHNHAKNAFIGGATLRNCFTYVHYIEQKYGAPYRFSKLFKAPYIDWNGKEAIKEYAMYVRNMDLNVEGAIYPLIDILYAKDLVKHGYLNGILYEQVRFDDVTPYIKNDVLSNRSRNICTYIGQ